MTTATSNFLLGFAKAFAESPRRFFSPLPVLGQLAGRCIGWLLHGGHRH
ncbi:hypothetical protein G3N59_25345 [Paraburkholderia sp. Ac-20340]|nr:hypothetical protein [Paraburkholderia sp. Ac-20340]MBN3856711.1 hypothetical protein [Paraburkholderia sp. Ac-20340]